jgi:hypothetical protein
MAAEVELRALLSDAQYKSFHDELLENGASVSQTRCFIDYSTFIEGIGQRKLDVRIRVTNGVPEFVVKRGEFGAAVREEALARIQSEDLGGALNVFALLGYTKGVLGGRRIRRGVIGPVEVALQEVLDVRDPKHVAERFVEVEYVGADSDLEIAEATLVKFLSDREASPFTIPEWNSFVKLLNEKWNGVYVHGETPISLVQDLGT